MDCRASPSSSRLLVRSHHGPSEHVDNEGVSTVISPPEQASVGVLVVEDDDFTRVTLKAALESYGLSVVATARDAKSALAQAVEAKPDVGIFDLDLGPGPTGIVVAKGIRRLLPDIGVVMLTSYEDPRLLSSSLADLPERAAYVVKQSLEDLEFLIEAITGSLTAWQAMTQAPRVGLTDAQIETLRLLACGLTNAEIARVRWWQLSRTATRLLFA